MEIMLGALIVIIFIVIIGLLYVKNKQQQALDETPTTPIDKPINDVPVDNTSNVHTLEKAEQFINTQQYDNATQELNRILAANPNNQEAMLKLLQVYGITNNHDAFQKLHDTIRSMGSPEITKKADHFRSLLEEDLTPVVAPKAEEPIEIGSLNFDIDQPTPTADTAQDLDEFDLSFDDNTSDNLLDGLDTLDNNSQTDDFSFDEPFEFDMQSDNTATQDDDVTLDTPDSSLDNGLNFEFTVEPEPKTSQATNETAFELDDLDVSADWDVKSAVSPSHDNTTSSDEMVLDFESEISTAPTADDSDLLSLDDLSDELSVDSSLDDELSVDELSLDTTPITDDVLTGDTSTDELSFGNLDDSTLLDEHSDGDLGDTLTADTVDTLDTLSDDSLSFDEFGLEDDADPLANNQLSVDELAVGDELVADDGVVVIDDSLGLDDSASVDTNLLENNADATSRPDTLQPDSAFDFEPLDDLKVQDTQDDQIASDLAQTANTSDEAELAFEFDDLDSSQSSSDLKPLDDSDTPEQAFELEQAFALDDTVALDDTADKSTSEDSTLTIGDDILADSQSADTPAIDEVATQTQPEPTATDDFTPADTQAIETASKPSPMDNFANDLSFAAGGSEAQITLDLANRYLRLGEQDSARRLLEEVLQTGNNEQRQNAQNLIARL